MGNMGNMGTPYLIIYRNDSLAGYPICDICDNRISGRQPINVYGMLGIFFTKEIIRNTLN
ncbi:hypothetical protein [Candidatus Contubernalis alkaliaceticus]|uniref:hypothetical protein n=1 Tax=Candidatus Contubernalis alkaliaceticus TaxID=338645 RepID=UPI001F4C484F|nr:hypothetical protein [Candidatus Contubernalis alkalaceticus]UNC93292.1 hypothetical protein HUE98_15065 [Candidatus Contubernalis alkalaceticus]